MTQEPATLQAQVEAYERALRLLLHNADEDDKLFQFRQSDESKYQICDEEYYVHIAQQEVPKVVARALHQFHPEVA